MHTKNCSVPEEQYHIYHSREEEQKEPAAFQWSMQAEHFLFSESPLALIVYKHFNPSVKIIAVALDLHKHDMGLSRFTKTSSPPFGVEMVNLESWFIP